MIPPHSRWYCSALRSIPAETTGLPSSVKPIAPASRSSAISVSSSPARPRVIAARKPTGTWASCRARWVSEPRTAAVSIVGLVFGIATIAQKPPAAAAAVPVSIVLLVLLTGRAQVHVRVDEAGEQVPAGGVDACRRRRARRACRASPISAIVAVTDEDVVGAVEVGARVQDVGAGGSAGRRAAGARRTGVDRSSRHQATAASVGEPTSSS